MNYLSIDWGEKRVGLALSEDGRLAFPLTVVNADQRRPASPALQRGRSNRGESNADLRGMIKQQVNELKKIIEERKVEKIILGWPIGLSGSETEKTKEVEAFYQELLTLNIPIEKIDERYSTKIVPREGRGIDMKDAVAAQILLQEYLDKISHS